MHYVKAIKERLTPVAGLITLFPLRYLTPLPSEWMNTLKNIIGGNSPPPNLQNKVKAVLGMEGVKFSKQYTVNPYYEQIITK